MNIKTLTSGLILALDILATGKNDEWVEVIKGGGTWSKIRVSGKIGYLRTKFLTK